MGAARPEFKSFHFTYGSAVGAGIQALFATGEYEKALLAAFLEWDMELLAGIDIPAQEIGKKEKLPKHDPKSFVFVIEAIKQFMPHYYILQDEWEIYSYEINGETKRAIELSARVYLPNDFVYRIYIDIVLRHKVSGKLTVLELKTDGAKYEAQESKYGNSNQALSYSVILDKIAHGISSFDVFYFVYYTALERWEFFSFTKTRVQKANWIRTVLYDTGNIHQCITDDFFPKQGESCTDYNSPCEYYRACDMSNFSLYAGDNVLLERVAKEDKEDYDFSFSLQEILDQQLEAVT